MYFCHQQETIEGLKKENDKLKEEIKCFKDTFTIDRVNKAAGQSIKMLEAENKMLRERFKQPSTEGLQNENKKLRRLMCTYKRSNTAKDKLIEHLRGDIESLRLASFEILGGKK